MNVDFLCISPPLSKRPSGRFFIADDGDERAEIDSHRSKSSALRVSITKRYSVIDR